MGDAGLALIVTALVGWGTVVFVRLLLRGVFSEDASDLADVLGHEAAETRHVRLARDREELVHRAVRRGRR